MTLMAKFGKNFRNKAVPIQLLNDATPIKVGALTPSAEVRRDAQAGFKALFESGAEIVPADETTATWVSVEFSNPTEETVTVSLESWPGSQRSTRNVAPGELETVVGLFGVGESYFSSGLGTLSRLIEKSI